MLTLSELEYTRFLEKIEALKNELPEPFRSRLEPKVETLERWKMDFEALIQRVKDAEESELALSFGFRW